tara:strand:- start:937 stop:1461 length:525 start_codon:yes stop_codon:yes gene_type:complete
MAEEKDDTPPEDSSTPEDDFEQSGDHADVKILPPFLTLGILALAVILELIAGESFLRWGAQLVLGMIGLSFGSGLMTWCIMRFINAGTALHPHQPSTNLVTDGPYGLSRNPIYVAYISLYLGVVLIFDIVWGLPLVIPLIYAFNRFVIDEEETYLTRRFGHKYEEYKASVRRWF